MSQGIILLLLIAAIVAYVVARTRRRMGMVVTARTWYAVMVGFVIVVLAMWAGSSH
jgi:predicted PurR-regulated permease PerM